MRGFFGKIYLSLGEFGILFPDENKLRPAVELVTWISFSLIARAYMLKSEI